VAQPPRRSRRIQGLPPELPGLSSTEENTDRSSNSPSLPLSNVETSLIPETVLVPPSTFNLDVLPTSSLGSEQFLPSDHHSRVPDTSFEFPDLIQFTEPLLETYLFPNEGPIQVSQVQSIVNQLLDSHPESLFEVYSKSSLPLNEEQGSNSTP